MSQPRAGYSLAAQWIGEFGFDEPPSTPVITPQNRYDAAGTGRRMRGWNPPTSGPNRAIQGTQKLKDRSRDANRNDWAGASGTQHWATNLIGIGIVPRLTQSTVSKTKKKLWTRLWKKWVKVSDADGVYNFYGQQTLAVRSWMESGEVFARKRYRRPKDGLPVPLQIQIIEADFIPMLDSDQWQGMIAGHRIRSGIELSRSGQRVAYWMPVAHIYAPRGSGRGASLDDYDALQMTTPVRFGNDDPRIAAGAMGENPRKPGALLPWTKRTGDVKRGIPVGHPRCTGTRPGVD